MKTRLTFVIAATMLFAASGLFAAEGWTTNYDKALEQAKAEQKMVLLDFTGSDWCAGCIRLKEEVFSKQEFKVYAKKNLVLVEIDFPNEKPQTESLKKQNDELASKFEIWGFPTLVVLDAEGKQLGQIRYMGGGPEALIAEIEKLKG